MGKQVSSKQLFSSTVKQIPSKCWSFAYGSAWRDASNGAVTPNKCQPFLYEHRNLWCPQLEMGAVAVEQMPTKHLALLSFIYMQESQKTPSNDLPPADLR